MQIDPYLYQKVMRSVGVLFAVILLTGCFGPSNVSMQQDCALAANIEACKAEKQREADQAAADAKARDEQDRKDSPVAYWIMKWLQLLAPMFAILTVLALVLAPSIKILWRTRRRGQRNDKGTAEVAGAILCLSLVIVLFASCLWVLAWCPSCESSHRGMFGGAWGHEGDTSQQTTGESGMVSETCRPILYGQLHTGALKCGPRAPDVNEGHGGSVS